MGACLPLTGHLRANVQPSGKSDQVVQISRAGPNLNPFCAVMAPAGETFAVSRFRRAPR